MNLPPPPDILHHLDAVPPHDRFGAVRYGGIAWDLSHLAPFVLHVEVEATWVTVVVTFSCHCFTHAVADDERSCIPNDDYYRDGRELRVLDPKRYQLSRQYLPRLVRELDQRQISELALDRRSP